MTKTSELSGKDAQGVATCVANGLPEVTQTQAFGPGYEVFKVEGKVLAMTTEVPGEKVLTIKCGPDRAQLLCDTHDSINPGYHMNKRHWISIGGGSEIDANSSGTSFEMPTISSSKRCQRPSARNGMLEFGKPGERSSTSARQLRSGLGARHLGKSCQAEKRGLVAQSNDAI